MSTEYVTDYDCRSAAQYDDQNAESEVSEYLVLEVSEEYRTCDHAYGAYEYCQTPVFDDAEVGDDLHHLCVHFCRFFTVSRSCARELLDEMAADECHDEDAGCAEVYSLDRYCAEQIADSCDQEKPEVRVRN